MTEGKPKMIRTETWVRIPVEMRPKDDPKWKDLKDPVIRVKMALYCHPDSGDIGRDIGTRY